MIKKILISFLLVCGLSFFNYSLAIYSYHGCGIKSDDTLVCWGSNNSGQSASPSGTFKQVSNSDTHSCGIKSDDTVVCWGDDSAGQSTPPNGTFKQVSVGAYNGCGIKSDDTVVCWGQNTSPSGTFKQISSGYNHSCGIKLDDTVSCWGDNTRGQASPPSGTFKNLTGGYTFSCGIKLDDTIACWGQNNAGQTIPPNGTFKQVSSGDSHSCGIKSDDTVVCWGYNHFGQTIPPSDNFKNIASGYQLSCGIKFDDTIVCRGNNWYGQLTPPIGSFKALWDVNNTLLSPAGDSNGNYTHYIFNRLTATEGNMQQVNNTAGSTTFSDSVQVKSNFLINYSYMQTWYENKGLTMDVINNNVDWNNGVMFSKTDVAGGMLNGYKLSAHYQFKSYVETDNHDSSIYWRTNLESTSFQTDTTWTNVGVPVYPIKNSSNNIVAYLEFPCGNLICKDQYCSDIQKITNLTPVNPIPPGTCNNNGVIDLMDEVCDGNSGVRHDLGETCNSSCQLISSTGSIIGCPTVPALGYKCNGNIQEPIFIPSTPTTPGGNIINWTPPGSIIMPIIGDINTNTGMTDTENTISDNVVCSVINEGYKNSNSIIVTNTMADTSFLDGLKGKSEYIKTLTGSSIDIVDKIISKKIKTSKLNNKSNLYDLGTKGTVSGIQFNLTKIPNSAVMRKLVKLAIDHSSTTMADYEQTIKDSCNGTITSTGTMVVPAGFIDVNEKGETVLNLFRFNGN